MFKPMRRQPRQSGDLSGMNSNRYPARMIDYGSHVDIIPDTIQACVISRAHLESPTHVVTEVSHSSKIPNIAKDRLHGDELPLIVSTKCYVRTRTGPIQRYCHRGRTPHFTQAIPSREINIIVKTNIKCSLYEDLIASIKQNLE
ncbi:hypothetical protein J6590_018693 [Homalodisca vitripennis]|nr:hypothetical protein J6590_018693 [Homalodisca vitripennis]